MTDQNLFHNALLDPAAPLPPGLHSVRGGSAQSRYGVYRNNVAVALRDALRRGFPVLGKLLGAQTFDQLADIFMRQHPPTTPLMMHYGAQMPAFLTEFGPLRHIGYLPDVARLEIALRSSYHASDSPPLEPEALGGNDVAQVCLRLAPSTILLQSVWPLYDIWRFNTQPDAPRPQATAQPVLITRQSYDPHPHPLTPAQACFVDALRGGQTISHAHDATCATHPDFALDAMIELLLRTDALTDHRRKDPL